MKNTRYTTHISIIFTLIMIFAFLHCTGKMSDLELETRELEKQLANSPDNHDLVENLLLKYFDLNKSKKFIELYEKYEESFEDNPAFQTYYASAMCMEAGNSKKIEDQLFWIKKGMIKFDELSDEYPDNKTVYFIKGITYSNFPAILDARSIAEEALDLCIENAANGKWDLREDEISYVYSAYISIALEYKDLDFLEKKYESLQHHIPDREKPIYKEYDKAIQKLKESGSNNQ
ncbi:MAG: hypothetical protein JXB88_17210 [Spirochaetales bacterium]|nr:hypothetical protein [Spirochaetales bacterium]